MSRRAFGLPGSVRARTTLAATAVVAVALAAAAVAVLLSLRSDLTGQADREADSTARDVALLVVSGVPSPTPYAQLRLRLPDAGDHPVQVLTRDGTLLAAGPGLTRVSGAGLPSVTRVATPAPTTATPGTPAPAAPAASASTATSARPRISPAAFSDGGKGRGRSGSSSGGDGGGRGADDDPATSGSDDGGSSAKSGGSGGHGSDDAPPPLGSVGDVLLHTDAEATAGGRTGDYRFVAIEVTDTARQKVVILAGASLAARQSAMATATDVMLAGLPALLLVVGGVTWLVTRRALTPVEDIRREMAAITTSGDLSRRVPQPVSRDEVARLARTTNETLTALEAAVDRQRRFVADASHELRNPIASLRTQLEVASAHPHLLDVPGVVEDAARLQRLAAGLLLLARLDAGEQAKSAPVDLGAMAREEIAGRAGDRLPVAFEAAAGPVGVLGSRRHLARVLGNLVDNAQRHARARITVRVGHDAARGEVVLAVLDDGPGVPEADRQRVFERFIRLDEARSSDDGGAGLGLAIARDIAERHGGRLTVGPSPEGGAAFELRLPGGR
ncbi:sensor histidine kinase [Streptomyces sp. NPDC049040]|uniref:sensor histidine kinase n=1 Tax=Streptomyces sp. NPDC049040 TaxID=3365593 RepID=UPI003722BAEC